MNKKHSLLVRQLNKYFEEPDSIPENIKKFIDAVNDAYFQFDEDRNMLERSLELSSEELLDANRELRNTEQLILKHNETLRQLSKAIEQSPNSIIIMDKNGFIQYVNPRFTRVTGFNLTDVFNKKFFDLNFLEMSSEEYQKLIDNTIISEEWKKEFRIKLKNNEMTWVYVSASVIKNEKNEATHFLIIAQDISDIKLYEQQLIIAKEKAELANETKDNFLAQMSHEIRTPLNIILSYNSLIKYEVQDIINNELSSSFNSIENASQRLIRTIDLILNMSEVQSNNFQPHFILLDLGDIVLRLVKDFNAMIKGRNLELKCVFLTDNTKVEADEYAIHQILVNLIDNAIKYTEHGTVEIILYSDITNSKNICIDIKDTGIGISEEFQSKLFTPFCQEDTGYTRSYEGNGLGLALVKKYVEINRGAITVKSKKGEGTIFTLTFKKFTSETIKSICNN